MSGYQNAVTDKLCILVYPNRFSFTVTSKLGHVKFHTLDVTELTHDLKGMLSSSIFTQTSVVFCNMAFSLCPKGLSKEDQFSHFQLSNEPVNSLETQQFSENIDLVFAKHNLFNAISDLLVNPILTTDIVLMHKYKAGQSRTNAIYLSFIDDHIVVRAYSAAKVLLVNRFKVENTDDMFYYVMFAVEQLNIDLSGAHFEFIGDSTDYANFKELFKNYLPMLLQLPLLPHNTDSLTDPTAFDNDWLSNVFLQCV